MEYRVKLKMGFYETTNYNFSILEGNVQFIPCDDETKETIAFVDDDLICIALMKKKNSEIEIITKNKMLSGTLPENADLMEIYQTLKKQINTKIIYEEE